MTKASMSSMKNEKKTPKKKKREYKSIADLRVRANEVMREGNKKNESGTY